MLRAIVYARVSTEEQAEHGTSLQGQKEAGKQLAGTIGAEVVAVLCDEGVSGTKYQTRPGIQQALKMIESGEANVLIATRIDRIGRSVSVILDIVNRVERAGGEVLTSDAKFDKTPAGKFLQTIYAGMAEMERDNIRERLMGGKVNRAKQGNQPIRNSPYGYHIVTKDDVVRGLYAPGTEGTYQVDADRAQWIPEIFRLFAAIGNLSAVVRYLESKGVTPPHGKHWYPMTIRNIIANSCYIGQAEYGKSVRVTQPGRKSKNIAFQEVNEVYNKPTPQEQRIKIACPRLVDDETFTACQAHLNRNVEEKQQVLAGNPKRKYMLSGLIRCTGCKRTISGYGVNRKKEWKYYSCLNRHCEKPKQITHAETLERMTVDALLKVSEEPSFIADALTAYRDHNRSSDLNNVQEQYERLQAELKALEVREQKTAKAQVDALIAGRATEVYDKLLSEITNERARLKTRLRECEGQLTTLPTIDRLEGQAEQLQALRGKLEKVLRANAADYSAAEKQEVLRTLIERIFAYEDGIEILLRSETLYRISTCEYQNQISITDRADLRRRLDKSDDTLSEMKTDLGEIKVTLKQLADRRR